MKYIKTYKLFEGRDEVTTRVSNRRDQAKNAIPEFISKMSEVINTNYEMYDFDENLIMDRLKSYLTAGKGKFKIDYKKICSDKGFDNTGRVVALILNFGYSIGYYQADTLNSRHGDPDIYFADYINDIIKCVHFERVSNNKLTYNGPNVLSGSVTASSFNTKQQIDKMDDMIERYYDGDSDRGEISVLIGCIYQYGYGLGNDTAYVETIEKYAKLGDILKNGGTPEGW